MASVGTMDDIAQMLEATGRYRCLRKVPAHPEAVTRGEMSCERDDVRVGVVVDVEATGTDPLRDTPIEVAMVKFLYRQPGRILGWVASFVARGEPPEPLSADVIGVTGIVDADLAGKRIDWPAAAAFGADADCFLAHNAGYDRAILETAWPGWPAKPWACTLNDIDWKAEGQFHRRLGDLLMAHGLYFDAHRAKADCEALLHLLTLPLPRSGGPALETLFANARRTSVRIFAEDAPYASSKLLRARGYRWVDARHGEGVPRCWSIELPVDRAYDEFKVLHRDVYRSRRPGPSITALNALNRYRPLPVIAAARVPADASIVEA